MLKIFSKASKRFALLELLLYRSYYLGTVLTI